MPDNNPNISIPVNEWVDLYTLTGITVGEVLYIENTGTCDVYLAIQAAQPDKDHNSYNIIKRDDDIRLTNVSGDGGAWAFCNAEKGELSISTNANEGFLPALKILLNDGFGNPIDSLKGAIDVHPADVHNIPVNDLFHRHTNISTTLRTATVSGDIQLDVDDTTGFSIGDLVHLGATNEYVEPRHPIITDIPDINTLVLDGPVHNIFAIGETVIKAIANMASLDGTLQNPVRYRYFVGSSRVEHITRILIAMTHTSAGADDLFGGIPPLTNGVHFQANVSGQYGSFTNWKTNGDIKLDMYDVDYSVKSGPGDFGTNGRGSFNRIGVVLRLDSTNQDFIEMLIQDTVVGTGLTDLRVKVQGHVEGA